MRATKRGLFYFLAAALTAPLMAMAQDTTTEKAEKLRDAHNKSVGSRANKSFYPADKWDLSDLGDYKPIPGLKGKISIGGTYLTRGTVLTQWQEEFKKIQPGVTFEVNDYDLETGLVDIVQKRGYTWTELHAFQDKFNYYPLEIEMATGSYNVPGWTPAFAIFVNKSNPVQGLTMDQLDGIFGGPRRGGWIGTVWNPDAARGREKNIRTWGQVGLTGEWKDREALPSGRPLKYHIQLYFERKVFKGGSIWNENLQEFAHELQPDGSRALSSVSIVKSVQTNPGGIAFADLASDMEGVKYLPIAKDASSPFVPLTLENLRDRSYPLYLEVFLYANRAPGKDLPPQVEAFLRYALSRQGQQAVQNDGKWLPLTKDVAAAQAKARLENLSFSLGGTKMKRMITGAVCMALLLSSGAALAQENANRSIWTLNVTDFRKANALKGGYTKQWDLSDLPHYTPKQKVKGVLRIWGSNYLKDGPLGGYWAEAFKKFQPGITIEYNLPTAGIAIPAVAGKVADLGVGRPATLMDHLTFEQVFKYPITEVTAATGSYDVYGWSPGFIIIVHKDNPLKQISMKQLDGVFGTARNGGYDGSTWRNDYPYKRGPEENIRTWGQLGVTGEWANKPIHPCGQSPRANIQVVFQNLVLRGSDQWVEGYRAFANYATPEGTINSWSKQVLAAAESDPLSMCIASPLALGANLRELAVQGFDGGPYVERTLETVRDRSYPLINEIFFYANKAPGKPMDPKVEEFLRFVLSQEGQNEIQREGRYTPLTAEVVREQLKKLESPAK